LVTSKSLIKKIFTSKIGSLHSCTKSFRTISRCMSFSASISFSEGRSAPIKYLSINSTSFRSLKSRLRSFLKDYLMRGKGMRLLLKGRKTLRPSIASLSKLQNSTSSTKFFLSASQQKSCFPVLRCSSFQCLVLPTFKSFRHR
jgi:hypothetical protein